MCLPDSSPGGGTRESQLIGGGKIGASVTADESVKSAVAVKLELPFYNGVMVRVWIIGLLLIASVSAQAQTPRPFPGTAPPAPAAAPAPRPAAPAAQVPAAQQPPANAGDPTAATLGFPIFPSAQFIASYDAGRGQRYYLFGSTTPFAELVTYYRAQLKERGALVFEEPPTHMFEVGRFRDETMAFPPGVTIKDWTWGGSQGYPNPRRGVEPLRFPTVIMVVPAPPAAAPAR